MGKMISLASVCLLLSIGVLCAQEPPKPPGKISAKASLAAMADAYQRLIEGITADTNKRSAVLQTWYLTSLEKLQGETAKKGDLDGALAFKAEKERIAAGTEPPQNQTSPEMLVKVRAAYDSALKTINDDASAKKAIADRKHIEELEFLQKSVTMTGDIDQALLVKAEKENFIVSLSALTAPKTTEPASTAQTPEPKTSSTVVSKSSLFDDSGLNETADPVEKPLKSAPASALRKLKDSATATEGVSELNKYLHDESTDKHIVLHTKVEEAPAAKGGKNAARIRAASTPIKWEGGMMDRISFLYFKDGFAPELNSVPVGSKITVAGDVRRCEIVLTPTGPRFLFDLWQSKVENP